MTSTATPSLNPGSPIVFGTGSAFGSESRLQAARRERGRKRTPLLRSPDHHSSGSIPNPARQVAPLRRPPFALNPCCLETPDDSTMQPFNLPPVTCLRLVSDMTGCPMTPPPAPTSAQSKAMLRIGKSIPHSSEDRKGFFSCAQHFRTAIVRLTREKDHYHW